ncbi:hypothetical protein B0A48_18579 [Cryoendolithus antarcticus]|uniref:Uncharacterized protein n=1 Tax=Cryoendolithus antarcticus TaxID=1507870 RepID=A0A1V8S906_9PEZI|nr:hypothetical protein B0A48_18579 [Cryoendolithus antarcticus]
MIVHPAVIFAFHGYAVSFAWFVAIDILNSFVLQAPLYNCTPSINGLANIPKLVGNLFGAWARAWLVDKYSDYRSTKVAGVFEPEACVHLLIITAVSVPAECLAFGFEVAQTLHWTALRVFFGYGMVTVGLAFVLVCSLVYVSDCYLPVNSGCLLLVNGLGDVIAFGFLYGVLP